MKFLPILIPSTKNKPDGTVDRRPVRTVSYGAVDLLARDPSAFRKKYVGEIALEEEKRLRGFLQLIDAVRGDKRTKIEGVAHQLAILSQDQEVWRQIEKEKEIQRDPLLYAQKAINERTHGASIVLWRQRSSGDLAAGVFCDAGLLDALYVLTLNRIGIGETGGTGSCDVCSKSFERRRGDRRRTCSDKCRKRASRMRIKAASRLRPRARRRRA